MKYIKKRNGKKVKFDIQKPLNAVEKAFDAVSNSNITDYVRMTILDPETYESCETVEDVQDVIEGILFASAPKSVYDAYTKYRAMRAEMREKRKKKDMLSIINVEINDITTDNANMNAMSPAGMMMKFASETTKQFTKDNLLAADVVEAMDANYIYPHDLDYYPTKSLTCVQTPLDKALQNGIYAGHGEIRPAKRIETAVIVAAISLETTQNEQHGGQSIPAFDFYMAPYVRRTYEEEIEKVCTVRKTDHTQKEVYKMMTFDDYTEDMDAPYEVKEAIKRTIGRVHQAMESFIHNCNNIHSRGGNQVVFSSVNYGTDTSPEGRLVIREMLKCTMEGVGNGATAIFPIHVFKCKKGINFNSEDPNYDLYKMSWSVSARRFFPNYLNLDASFNIHPKWEPGKFEFEPATMGALAGKEHLYIKIDNQDPIDISIRDFYHYCKTGELKNARPCQVFFNKEPLPALLGNKTTQEKSGIPSTSGVYAITYLPEDITYIGSTSNLCRRYAEHKCNIRLTGKIDGGFNPADRDFNNYKFEVLERTDDYKEVEKKYIESSPNVNFRGTSNKYYKTTQTKFGKLVQERPRFKQNLSYKQDLINIEDRDIKVLDKDNKWTKVKHVFKNSKHNTPLMMHIYYIEYDKEMCISCTEDHPLFNGEGYTRADQLKIGDTIYRADGLPMKISRIGWSWEKMDSYDIGTVSGSFIGSDIIMHNCRTRTWSNRFGESTSIGRGNLSFTSINLPKLAIEVAIEDGVLKKTKTGYEYVENGNTKERIQRFMESLKKYADLAAKQLDDRYKFQATARKEQFPLLMSGTWMDSDKLKPGETIEKVIKHGTLAIGFIGLAEALIALTGKHHGEDPISQGYGLQIVGYLNKLCKMYSDEYDHNYACFATPAEGLSGRFTVRDRDTYGVIEHITDKEYYTNSSHVPVWYDCSPQHKAKIECPYHILEPAGHIFYVEANADITKNPEAVDAVNRIAFAENAGYVSINHTQGRCRDCNYESNDPNLHRFGSVCPKCGGVWSTLDRCTGYLVGNYMKQAFGKKAEILDRIIHK